MTTDEHRVQDHVARRTHDTAGHQIVRCGNYAYVWTGRPALKVGDVVRLPPNWLFNEMFDEAVTALGTDYLGALAEVVKVVRRTDEAPSLSG